MSIAIGVLSALVAAGAAWLLTRVMTAYVPGDSPWVTSRLHILLAAIGGLGAARLTDHPAVLVALVAATVGCSLLVVIDLAVHRLPDKPVALTFGAMLVALGIAAATGIGWMPLGRALLAALVLVSAYFVLAFIAPDGLGLGDVKFAAVIGLVLGWFDWSQVAIGTLLAFLLNGLVALIVVIRHGKIKGSEVPFGPSMVLGAVLALII
ncbi:prepilin peptidase [Enteractinococcus coprophilus]|uniref:Leader peptidase (Prepilin peptidase)/N-methyltransferase n=1 Tax=Enteractinococcus coprophilus TaxID=1027633 RepID=A0A543AGM1_9MICC|nr:A24 family peptidase [Enteractinococcus coprophilus]TQL71656.1 leader peptidase (prepilin peptidase)/N-methyltransferase [Enteractinococcus coprophilus]